MTAKDVAREASGTPADGLAEFRIQVNATSHPPGPIDAMLGEAIVHSEEIRRPLGISHTYPTDAVTRVADFYKGANLTIKWRVGLGCGAGLRGRAAGPGCGAGLRGLGRRAGPRDSGGA